MSETGCDGTRPDCDHGWWTPYEKGKYMLTRLMTLMILALGSVPGVLPTALHAQEPTVELPTLYKRIGGYDAIAATVDNFLERYDNDPELMPFNGGLNTAESRRIRQHFVDYLCERTGGPCLYLGRNMTETHEGLAITDALFDRVMQHLDDALTDVGILGTAKQELLAMLSAVRPQTVTR